LTLPANLILTFNSRSPVYGGAIHERFRWFNMKHRDIEFSVVQTACPTGWEWTVHLDVNRTKISASHSTISAIIEAQWRIDRDLGQLGQSSRTRHDRQ
jgi:hypothetical protein